MLASNNLIVARRKSFIATDIFDNIRSEFRKNIYDHGYLFSNKTKNALRCGDATVKTEPASSGV